MSRANNPVSEEALKRLSGEFDLEGIMVLDLSDQGLLEYGAIPQCIQLRVLNLSLNQLSSLSPLATLTSLQRLDLSANQITTLEGIDKLNALREINLAGNKIFEFDALLPLSSLPHLTHLTLSLPGSSLTNPVCSHHSYTSYVSESLPCLQWLDGEKVGGAGAEFYTKCRQIEEQCSNSIESVDEKKAHESDVHKDPLPDPLANFSLASSSANEGMFDGAISKLLSECSDASGKLQSHIQSLKTLVASDNT